MKEKGFATSAILYTILLLFLVLMVGILNNLQNKKTLLDALKKDTIYALEKDTLVDAILEQVGIINGKITEIENQMIQINEKINEIQMNGDFKNVSSRWIQVEITTTNIATDGYYYASLSYSSIPVLDGTKRIAIFPIGAFLKSNSNVPVIVNSWMNAYVKIWGKYAEAPYIVYLQELYVSE